MNQSERIQFLINELKNEDKRYKDLNIPNSYLDQVTLLRSLMNVRMPKESVKNFYMYKMSFYVMYPNRKVL